LFGTRDGTAFDGVQNKQVLLTNVADWDIGGSGFVLSSLTGWRDNSNYFGTDSDHSDAFAFFSPGPPPPPTAEPVFANTNADDQRDFSQEIRLVTPKIGAFRFLLGGSTSSRSSSPATSPLPAARTGCRSAPICRNIRLSRTRRCSDR
jgi:hypothetical protein